MTSNYFSTLKEETRRNIACETGELAIEFFKIGPFSQSSLDLLKIIELKAGAMTVVNLEDRKLDLGTNANFKESFNLCGSVPFTHLQISGALSSFIPSQKFEDLERFFEQESCLTVDLMNSISNDDLLTLIPCIKIMGQRFTNLIINSYKEIPIEIPYCLRIYWANLKRFEYFGASPEHPIVLLQKAGSKLEEIEIRIFNPMKEPNQGQVNQWIKSLTGKWKKLLDVILEHCRPSAAICGRLTEIILNDPLKQDREVTEEMYCNFLRCYGDSLVKVKLDSISTVGLLNIAQVCRRIEWDLKHCMIGFNLVKYFGKKIKSLQILVKEGDNSNQDLLLDAIMRCSHLEYLRLRGSNIESEAFRYHYQTSMGGLKTLVIDSPISQSHLKTIASANTRLEKLEICLQNIGPRTNCILDILKANPRIAVLVVTEDNMEDNPLEDTETKVTRNTIGKLVAGIMKSSTITIDLPDRKMPSEQEMRTVFNCLHWKKVTSYHFKFSRGEFYRGP